MGRWIELLMVLLVGGCAAVPATPMPVGLNPTMSSGHTHQRDSEPGESVTIDGVCTPIVLRCISTKQFRAAFLGRILR